MPKSIKLIVVRPQASDPIAERRTRLFLQDGTEIHGIKSLETNLRPHCVKDYVVTFDGGAFEIEAVDEPPAGFGAAKVPEPEDSRSQPMKFEIYRELTPSHAPKSQWTKPGDWRWRLRAKNGRIVAASGEGYKRASDMVRVMREPIFWGSPYMNHLIDEACARAGLWSDGCVRRSKK